MHSPFVISGVHIPTCTPGTIATGFRLSPSVSAKILVYHLKLSNEGVPFQSLLIHFKLNIFQLDATWSQLLTDT
jgi:hypothetical protein